MGLTLSHAAAAMALTVASAAASGDPRVRIIDLNHAGLSSLNPYKFDRAMVVAGGVGYFAAGTAEFGTELWRTDGAESGTLQVKDIYPGEFSSSPSQLTALGNLLLFVAYTPDHGPELWRSDGTPTGTFSVAELPSGAPWPGPQILDVIDSPSGPVALFVHNDGSGPALWRTDGSLSGTSRLRIFQPDDYGYSLTGSWAVLGATMLFSANDGVHGRELWATDGTLEGTHLVADLVPGPAGSDPSDLAAAAGRVYFAASTDLGTEPWSTNGLESGTLLIGDLVSGLQGEDSSKPTGFRELQGKVFFSAWRPDSGRELWVVDDGANGGPARIVADIAPGSNDGLKFDFESASVGGRFLFVANDGVSGDELWSSDGAETGTHLLADLSPGAAGSSPAVLTVTGGEARPGLLLQALTQGADYGLWWIDASTWSPPRQLCALGVGVDALTRPVMVLGATALFPAYSQSTGLELHSAPIPAGGATLVKDIRQGSIGSAPTGFVSLGNHALFAATADSGSEPYITDGTAEGTLPLADILPGPASSNPRGFCHSPDTAIFVADDAPGGQSSRWFGTTGSPDATVPLGPAAKTTDGGTYSARLDGTNRCVFAGASAGSGAELWVSDGTPAGTSMVKDLNPGATSSSPFGFAPCGQVAVFFANLRPGSVELWRTDGSADGTSPIVTISAPGIFPVSLTVAPITDVAPNGYIRVYFDAADSFGDELWVTDGSDEGTYRVADINPGQAGSFPSWLCSLGGRVLFSASDSVGGAELWITDGGPLGAGTHRVKDIWPGPSGSNPRSIVARGDTACFAANDGSSGFELWSTDGTDAGTSRLTDVYPGPADSVYRVMASVGTSMVFQVSEPGQFGLRGGVWEQRDSWPSMIAPLTPAATAVSPPVSALVINNRVFYSGYATPDTGPELAVLDLCPADYDNSGLVSVQDIFAFLEAYFRWHDATGSGLGPDFDGNNAIDLGDLFEFLRQYFTGCN